MTFLNLIRMGIEIETRNLNQGRVLFSFKKDGDYYQRVVLRQDMVNYGTGSINTRLEDGICREVKIYFETSKYTNPIKEYIKYHYGLQGTRGSMTVVDEFAVEDTNKMCFEEWIKKVRPDINNPLMKSYIELFNKYMNTEKPVEQEPPEWVKTR